MLQTACMSPELLVNQSMSESEICAYSPGQGSPLPGETASPKSCFQQSPSLPDSGLTELNVASPKIYHPPPPPPPCKPPGMPAPADSELSSDPPQKRYMGVRVKMPVRELLRKIRLSKGLDAAHGKEASSVKMVTKGSSGKTAEKRRAHPYTEKQLRQSKQSAGQSPKGLEDLDILVEVLQEDLNESQLREEPPHPVPDGLWQGFCTDPQSSRWQSVASKEAAGDLQGRERSSAELHQEPFLKDFHPILEGRELCLKDFHPSLQGREHSSAGLHQELWFKDFHPIGQGREPFLKDFHPILQGKERSSAELHREPCLKDFHPILQGKELCLKDFHPILQGKERSSEELHQELCLKDFHPILQGRERSSAELHQELWLKDFHPIGQGRERSSAELHQELWLKDFHPIGQGREPCLKDFHPILEGKERSSAELHRDPCLKDFQPILQGRERSSEELHQELWFKDFHPIGQGRELCLKNFHPILQGRERSSAGLQQEPFLKNFHPILQGKERSSAGLPQELWLKDFHPILQGRERSSAELPQELWLKDFHPILQGRERSSAELPQELWLKDFHPIPRAEADPSFPGEQGSARSSSPPGMLCRTGFGKGSSWGMQDALPSSRGGFPRNSPCQDTPALLSPQEMLLEARRGSADTEGHPRLTPMSCTQQDPSALSFFQFQLRREENWLRNIPAEKLLAPDENGNRLLHKAVAQGRRALTFALAQRFASLNKIDEKDAEKRTALHLAAEKNQHLMVNDLISLGASVNEQDSSGKTPLHLCAENGYLRVLQVLKSCKANGVRVEVDLPDHCGFTPLHCAALAHTVLVAESHSPSRDSSEGRLLRLRKEQILEGILCLLQMGAKPELQVLNSCPTSSTCLKLEENTELMCLLQTHKPQGQDVLHESYSLLDAPRGIPGAPAAQNSPELCSMASPDLFDVLLQGKC